MNYCYKCSNLVRNTIDFTEKAKKIHGDFYNKSRKKIIIVCKIYADFL